MYPTYHPSQNKELKQKLAAEKRDIERRSKYNKIIEEEDKIQKANWRDVNPMKRSPTLNNFKGGRKRNSTKKKRRNKTKKREIKNKRK